MTHYTDDDLVLYYYGEARRPERIERHLDACAACRKAYEGITAALGAIGPARIPERDERYGLAVWQRIRHELPMRDRGAWTSIRLACASAAVAVVIVAGFVAAWLAPRRPVPPRPVSVAAANDRAAERIRVEALADHLDRSERLLLDLEHDPTRDIGDEQAWASDLVAANRLYRDAAVRAGDVSSAAVLEDLERQLLDIVHAPSKLTPRQVEDLRTRLDAAALLFKVRVLHDQLRGRETTAAPASPRTTT